MIEKPALSDRSLANVSLLFLTSGLAVAVGLFIRSGQAPRFSDFTTVLVSILFEAFPFVLIGTILSSIIHLFVTPELLGRIIPRNRFIGLVVASIAGFAFPICECANVPVTRRLIAKGMPVPVAVTFLLAVAIVNPVVLFSTWIAFGGDWTTMLLRGGLGMLIAIVSGWLVSLLPESHLPLRQPLSLTSPGAEGEPAHGSACACGHEHVHEFRHGAEDIQGEESNHYHNNLDSGACSCGQEHQGSASLGKGDLTGRVRLIMEHTASELYAVGRFLIMGAAVAALMQTLLPRSSLLGIGSAPVLSILVLMFLAYVLSLCSEADAFIAATFAGYFSPGAVMAFMVYGPMMDVKNTLMLLEGFKPRFVALLFILTTILCLLSGLALNSASIWGG